MEVNYSNKYASIDGYSAAIAKQDNNSPKTVVKF